MRGATTHPLGTTKKRVPCCRKVHAKAPFMEPCPQDDVCRRLARLTLGRVQPSHGVPPGATCGECAGPLQPTVPCFKCGVFPGGPAGGEHDVNDLLCLPCALQCAETFTDTFHTSVFSGVMPEDGSALEVVFAFDDFDSLHLHGVPVQGELTQERLHTAAEIMTDILRSILGDPSDVNGDADGGADGEGDNDIEDSSYGTDDAANDSDGLLDHDGDSDIDYVDNDDQDSGTEAVLVDAAQGPPLLDGATLAQRCTDALDHGVWSFPFNLHRQRHDVYCDRCLVENPKVGVLALPDDNFDLCLACAVAVAGGAGAAAGAASESSTPPLQ